MVHGSDGHQQGVADAGKYATALSTFPPRDGGSTLPAQNRQVIVTIMKVEWATQTTAGAGVTSALLMMPGNTQLPAVVTANCWASVQLGDAIAAHRAVSEAVDCSTPCVHNRKPPSRMARQSGRKIPATKPNSSAAAPLRSHRKLLDPIIAAAQ
jgi:hypothetical protein